MVLFWAENIHVTLGAVPVLNGASIRIGRGDRAGVIGPNGCGKTTLVDSLTGVREIDSGSVRTAAGVRVGFVSQTHTFQPGASVRDVAVAAFHNTLAAYEEMQALLHQSADFMTGGENDDAVQKRRRLETLEQIFHAGGGYDIDHRVDHHLTALGFDAATQARPADTLSGGEAIRLELCRVLLGEPDVIILDEPTNHLDVTAIEWLQHLLIRENKTVLVVSHDRRFLDTVCTKIYEMSGGVLHEYKGNYSAYLTQRAAEQQRRLKEKKIQDRHIAKEEAYIRQHMAGQRTRQAQGRLKKLSHIKRVELKQELGTAVHLEMAVGSVSGETVFELENVRPGYDGAMLFKPFSATVTRGEKIGISGANGTGKSSLIKILAGELPPAGGAVRTGHNVRIGYHRQEAASGQSGRVIDIIAPAAGGWPESRLRDYLGFFMFSGDDAFKDAAHLSGGEAGRLSIARLCLSGANTLLLDEPTNHLDIYMRESFQSALKAYPGTVILISHDRQFLDEITTRTWVIGDGRIQDIPYPYSLAMEHLKDVSGERHAARNNASVSHMNPSEPVGCGVNKSQARRPKKINMYKLKQAEDRLHELEDMQQTLESEMLMEENYTDGLKMRDLARRLDEIKLKIQEAETHWAAIIDAAD